VQRTVSSDQTQHTVSDEAVEEVSKQPHRRRTFPDMPIVSLAASPCAGNEPASRARAFHRGHDAPLASLTPR
jgi:hypothetical protein